MYETDLEPEEHLRYQQTERALHYCVSAIGTLAIVVLLVAVWIDISAAPGFTHGRATLAVVLTMGASTLFGVIIGLLFGIPMTGSFDSDRVPAEVVQAQSEHFKRRHMLANDSLVRVSQWLTTVIVGVTLVQFHDALAWVNQLGTAVSHAVFGSADSGTVAIGVAAITTFSFGGFLISYLWTRVYLPRELARSERDVDQLSEQEQQAINQGAVQERPGVAGLRGMAPQRAIQRLSSLLTETALKRPGEETVPQPIAPGEDPDDPWHGVFGGAEENAGYRLWATVKPSKIPLFFVVDLRLAPTSRAQARPSAVAMVYLHPSFPKPRREWPLDASGTAQLSLLAWGAFTVGVEMPDGARLELNLGQIKDAPEVFRNR